MSVNKVKKTVLLLLILIMCSVPGVSCAATDSGGQEQSGLSKDLKKVKCIAHRGLLTEAPENTAKAFTLAGQKHFWGAECDVWETMHDEKDGFDIVVNHDATFDRMTNYSGKVGNYTAEEIKNIRVTGGSNAEKYGEGICDLNTFLNICSKYKMVPFVEIKGSAISDAGIKKILSSLKKKHLLKKAWICSLEMNPLKRAAKYAKKKYKVKLKTCYMIFGDLSQKAVMSKIKTAHKKKIKGMWLNTKFVNKKTYKKVKKYKMEYMAGAFEKTKSDSMVLEYAIKKLKIKKAFLNGAPSEF
jgi:glycerophosphoryl diester phosphodiesterase